MEMLSCSPRAEGLHRVPGKSHSVSDFEKLVAARKKAARSVARLKAGHDAWREERPGGEEAHTGADGKCALSRNEAHEFTAAVPSTRRNAGRRTRGCADWQSIAAHPQ